MTDQQRRAAEADWHHSVIHRALQSTVLSRQRIAGRHSISRGSNRCRRCYEIVHSPTDGRCSGHPAPIIIDRGASTAGNAP